MVSRMTLRERCFFGCGLRHLQSVVNVSGNVDECPVLRSNEALLDAMVQEGQKPVKVSVDVQ
jgi:hypothetical protein